MFAKATKAKAKYRGMLSGPSGSGKTFSALRVATGFGGKIAVIDSERGRAEKYADKFTFDACQLKDYRAETYIELIKAAKSYDVLIIDSLTHQWELMLREKDALAASRFGGNSWAAWSEISPRHQALLEAITTFPGHVIATCRAKVGTEQARDDQSGRIKVVKTGLKPIQRDGIEYEFDVHGFVSQDHLASIEKDNSGLYQDQTIMLTEEHGMAWRGWLSEGSDAPKPETPIDKLNKLIAVKSVNEQTIMGWLAHFKVTQLHEISPENIERIIKKLETQTAVAAA